MTLTVVVFIFFVLFSYFTTSIEKTYFYLVSGSEGLEGLEVNTCVFKLLTFSSCKTLGISMVFDIRLQRYKVAQISGCRDIRLHRYQVAQISGCIDIRIQQLQFEGSNHFLIKKWIFSCVYGGNFIEFIILHIILIIKNMI